MGVPTGAGNYPPGVTDNDPHFDSDPDEEPEYDEEWACTWCGGDGTMENDDPVFYGHNRDIKCSACGGTGLREYQTVF